MLLAVTPPARRPGMALWLLGPGPSGSDGRDESAWRSRRSREVFVRDVLAPYLAPEQDLLDVGCGPGYLARAVAGRVWSVAAIDISRGALACARVLNPALNIDYRTPRQFFESGRRVDVAVCLALAEQLDDQDLSAMLTSVRAVLRPGGRLLMRVAIEEPDGRPDGVPARPVRPGPDSRRRSGPYRAVRTGAQAVRLVEWAGFTQVEIVTTTVPGIESPEGAGSTEALDDDGALRRLLVARRPLDAPADRRDAGPFPVSAVR
ncbi:class I SAM-dependent methyltransferase [Parafrankia discariae]|uniref:class I SAM-dependent methyltransferase n=1 Tax=Parafrankia discariae TaxID=365528 RepID=UPI00036AB8C4|nr:class I SAM-dependent methyltransferase [Parafrankia discariae]